MSNGVGAVLVARCICRNVSFEDLLARARTHSWTLDDIVQQTGCGSHCGLCRPYLRRMLATGETEFHDLLSEEEPPRDARGKL